MESKQIRRTLIGLLVLAVFVALVTLAFNIALKSLKPKISSGIASGLEKIAEHQLKTAVAVIELHKVRYGEYPKSLKDLKFTSEMDAVALNCVTYYPNVDGTAYFIEFDRDWIKKEQEAEMPPGSWPEIEMPAEFWQGTGYDPSIRQESY